MDGDDIPAYTPVTPEKLFNGVQILSHTAPWNHLHAFELPDNQLNQRFLPALEYRPISSHIASTTASPRGRVAADGRILSLNHGSLRVSYPALDYLETTAVPFAAQVSPTENLHILDDEPNSAISPRSGTQAWSSSSPPDSGVVFVCDDSITESRLVDTTEPYGFTGPAAMDHSKEAIELESIACQSKRLPLQELRQREQEKDDELEEKRRISTDTGHETLDHEVEGGPKYRLEGPPNTQDRQIQLTAKVSLGLPEEESIKGRSIEGTCERFQPNIASSFPPTAGFFPQYWPDKQNTKNTKPTSGPFPLRPAIRSRTNRQVSISTIDQLSVIHEYGKGTNIPSAQASRKGRRAGPLSKAKATQAAIIRKNKSVCIRCKMMKQSVRTLSHHKRYWSRRLT